MFRQEIALELRILIEDYLKPKAIELVDFIYRYEGRDLVVRILVDYPQGGITVGECSQINREIGLLLDEKNILEDGYILEVSSPGLDRPLKTKSDFLRCVNRKIRLFLSEPVNVKKELEGVVEKIEEDNLHINCETGILVVPLTKINRGKYVLE